MTTIKASDPATDMTSHMYIMPLFDSQELPLFYNLHLLATTASTIDWKTRKGLVSMEKKNQRTVAAAVDLQVTKNFPKRKRSKRIVVTNLSEPPLKKLKEELAEPIVSSVGTDLTLMQKKKNPNSAPPMLRDAPVCLKQRMEGMNGSEAILVVEKLLTDSDVRRNQSRLLIPESHMNKFLSDEEINFLKIKVGNNMNGIEALVHQYSRCEWECSSVKIKRWEMMKKNGSASIMYVLTTGWNSVVSRNKLKTGNAIQVWSFRVEQKLHLAVLLLS